MNTKLYEQVFFDKEELLISVLGQNYFESILAGKIEKSVLILSSKRLYQQGKIFEKVNDRKWKSFSGQKVVDVKDITGSSFTISKNITFLILAIILTLILCSQLLNACVAPAGPQQGAVLPYLVLLSLLPITFYLLYFFSKRKMFIVEFAGGSIGTKANWYSQEELNDFQKQIALLGDQYK